MQALLSDVELFRRLVAFDTTSSNSNLPMVDFLGNYLDRPGARIVRQASPDGDKANLLAFLGPEVDPGARTGLILSGHMDVVPAREEGWTSDPFTLAEQGDRWAARGACDMKGFLALAANLFARQNAAQLHHSLVLLFTYDEELGTLGAQYLARTWSGETLPRSAVIGEPTSLEVVRMHKGHLRLEITLRGKSAHSGLPHLGWNAIEAGGRVINALATLRQELAAERPAHHEHFPEVPFVTLNVAQIEGGVADNVIPDRCEICVGLRPLPGVVAADLVARVGRAVESADPGAGWELRFVNESAPMICPEEASVHQVLCALMEQRESRSVSFATDAGPLQTLGLESVIWGPGSISVAHQPNEFLPQGEFERAGKLLPDLVRQLCG